MKWKTQKTSSEWHFYGIWTVEDQENCRLFGFQSSLVQCLLALAWGSCIWLTGVAFGAHLSQGLMCCLFWDAFQIIIIVKSGYVSYHVSSNQSTYHLHLLSSTRLLHSQNCCLLDVFFCFVLFFHTILWDFLKWTSQQFLNDLNQPTRHQQPNHYDRIITSVLMVD